MRPLGGEMLFSRVFSLKRCAAGVLLLIGLPIEKAAAQPALTTIADILYRADGTRFNGTMYITWNAFQGGDTSDIATANVILPIVNGVLQVSLVPTTTASAGAQYNVTFNQNGVNQFTQVWAVPPSSTVLRIRDVLVSTGTVVGPAPETPPIQISDVVGLSNALALTAQKGVGFALGRTAIIDDSGLIDGAAGNLSDCVRVDGSSGPCGNSSGVYPSFSDSEIPGGAINGSNTSFTLTFTPSPVASLELYLNGLRLDANVDYSLAANVITFFVGSTPQTGDLLLASYRYANPSNPLGSLTTPQVVCSSTGGSTTATTLTQIGSCTMPAGLLGTGDRIEIEYQYSHTGSAIGFTNKVQVAGATVETQTAAASETMLVGHTSFGIYSGGQTWDTTNWGSTTAFAASAGSASIDPTQAVTVSFQAQMGGTGTDSVTVRSFAVIRYPAQTNP